MTVDYQHNETEIKAFNLKDGSLIWESDQLDIGVSVAETIISAHASGGVNTEINGTSIREAHRANNLFTRDRFLDRLINYIRSEEHTSELQSRPHLVCRLLLEKKKQKISKY